MKKILLISVLFLGMFSCKQSHKNQQAAPETPKALQENSTTDYSLVSKKRYDDDLVERLYSELVDKTPELKDLEDRIDKLGDARTDSVKDFNDFNDKNTGYYSATNRHLNQITDSLLRDKIKLLINNSLAKYNIQIARHKNLISALDSKNIQLQDLHIILKLVKTLTLMEKYQKDNIPTTKSIEKVINGFDKTIQKTDSLINK